jgi:hypothetical protein
MHLLRSRDKGVGGWRRTGALAYPRNLALCVSCLSYMASPEGRDWWDWWDEGHGQGLCRVALPGTQHGALMYVS